MQLHNSNGATDHYLSPSLANPFVHDHVTRI